MQRRENAVETRVDKTRLYADFTRNRVAEIDVEGVLAASPARNPELMGLLARCHSELVADMGGLGTLERWPALPESLGGVGRYHLHVQIKKRQEGEAKNVMLGAFAGHYDVKHVIVVDEDVDIHDPAQVEWAVATRFQADQDLVIVPNSQGSKLDPSTRDGVGAKMGLDATKPLTAAEMTFKRIRVPGEEKISVDELLHDGGGMNWRDALKR